MNDPPGAATPAERLEAGITALGLDLPAGSAGRMLEYLDLLVRWNRVYNLTAVRDPDEMVTRHLLDALAVAPWLEGSRLLDVGTGAGLPGIVLAIARPELEVVLLDSSAKRTRFCVHAAGALALANVQVVTARVEAHRDPAAFPCIVSRAVAPLAELLAACRHLLADGGVVLAMKGRDPAAEIAALGGAGLAEVVVLEVPGLAAERHLVRWRA